MYPLNKEPLKETNEPTDSLAFATHANQHNDVNRIVNALQDKIGIENDPNTSSLDFRVKTLESTSGGAGAVEPPKTFAYLAPYKPRAEIEAFRDEFITGKKKMWATYWELVNFDVAGAPIFLTESGSLSKFSSSNYNLIKEISDTVLMGVVGRIDDVTSNVSVMLADSGRRSTAITLIYQKVQEHGFGGVYINFEPTTKIQNPENVKIFIQELRAQLGDNYVISFSGPMSWDTDKTQNKVYDNVNYTGESNLQGTNHNSYTVNDMHAWGVDIVEMMCYDQYYDFGTATHSVTSYSQFADANNFLNSRLSVDNTAVSIGNYGIETPQGDAYSNLTNNMTRADINAKDSTFFTTATERVGTGYLHKDVGANAIIGANQRTVQTYYDIAVSQGRKYIGFWLMGDHPFPTIK